MSGGGAPEALGVGVLAVTFCLFRGLLSAADLSEGVCYQRTRDDVLASVFANYSDLMLVQSRRRAFNTCILVLQGSF